MSWTAHVRRVPADWDYENFDAERDEYPKWPKEQRTHWQWWQDKTDPSPISPIFALPDEMATYILEGGWGPWFDWWRYAIEIDEENVLAKIRKEGESP